MATLLISSMAQRVGSPKSKSKSSRSRTLRQSPALAGGAGFTLEDEAAALYLGALLAEESAPGLDPFIVKSVALQQREFGEPLDDLIVDGRTADGSRCRLSLQVKSSLTVSAAQSNSDFREIIADSWATLKKADFSEGLDRFGAITRTTSERGALALQSLCELARASPTSESFEKRLAATANARIQSTRGEIETLLTEIEGVDSRDIHRFLQHFVLIRLDALHAGAINLGLRSAQSVLAPEAQARAPDLLDHLRVLARQGAGRSASFDRSSLISDLATRFPLLPSRRLGPIIERLNTLAKRAAEEIEDTVAGVRLDRRTAKTKLATELSRNRFVQIHGLPGTGKSVLLRRAVEEAIQTGATIFLKSDRMEGVGWAGYAQRQGIPDTEIPELLIEIASLGTAILFVDGLDRVERTHRPIVYDLIQSIFADERLNDWRVVATVRDAGIEPLRTWLPTTVFAGGIGNVAVGTLEDEECRTLADADESLRPILFGTPSVREIARRPFFTKIVSQSLRSGDPEHPAPQSEVDLANGWWARGGYDTTGVDALERQRALIDLATTRTKHLNEPISLRALKSETIKTIDSLRTDGILQTISNGHSVQFAHDIFFEWSFLHALADDPEWQNPLTDAGEPPILGRVVELLSQTTLTDFQRWRETLASLEGSKLRTQWLRAWVLAPFSMADFDQISAAYWETLAQNNFLFLQKALVWFQAERTSPNIGILEGVAGSADVSPEHRLLAADLLGWPSDLDTWRRLIGFINEHLDEVPGPVYPHVISIFEVWQNALADIRNPVSELIVGHSATWLRELEENERRTTRRNPLPQPWRGIKSGRGELRRRLRQIVLRGGRAYPDQAAIYLRRLTSEESIDTEVFKQVVSFAPVLSETHPELLVDFTLHHLREELPEDRIARHQEERDEAAKLRQAVLEKPESERTSEDKLILDSVFHSIGFRSVDMHDWNRLAIRDEFFYFPASPLREPFHSLFKEAPASALRLVRELSNHAVQAWRQLHRLNQDGTPLPIRLTFPWGGHAFWGTPKEYLWARGIWGPKPIACAYQSLDVWARRQIEDGTDADRLIQQIVAGNDSIAALAAAVCVALRAFTVSDANRPLLQSPRLWRADLQRLVQESGFKLSSRIGFKPNDRQHIRAVEEMNAEPVRQCQLRQLVAIDVLQSASAGPTSMSDLVRRFAEDLPFEYEEEQGDPEVREQLEKAAAVDVEWLKAENYHLVESEEREGRRAIAFVNPQAETEEVQSRLAEGQRHLNANGLHIWASKSFEQNRIDDAFSIDAAFALARDYDRIDAFSESTREDLQGSVERGALAGTAAVILAFAAANREQVEWARGILERAVRMREAADELWLSQSIISWHPGIFVARAAAAEIKSGSLSPENAERLLRLIAHPLECVGLEAISLTLGLWAEQPRLAWCGLCLALGICHLPTREEMYRSHYGRSPDSIMDHRAQKVSEILSNWRESAWPELPLPPPAWLEIGSEPELLDRRYGLGSQESDDELIDRQEWTDESVCWREPRVVWDDQLAAKVISKIPAAAALGSDTRQRVIVAIERLLGWTIEKLSPSWEDPPRRRPNDANIFEWTHSLARLLGTFCGHVDVVVADTAILAPVCKLRDDPCFALLGMLTDTFICAHILDSDDIAATANLVLERAASRLLQVRELQPDTYRAGELYGFDVPLLARSLLFVSVERALGAARFVNGDWREIDFILPTVDRVVRAAGWAPVIMEDFLTLCERARDAFPAENFADDVLEVLRPGAESLSRWQSTLIPGRIAGLIQHFSERDAPLGQELARKLLRILDALVDMGDRRSAALQTSAAFRDVRV